MPVVLNMFNLCTALLGVLSLCEVNAQLQQKTVSVQLAGNRSRHDAAEGKMDLCGWIFVIS